VAKFLYTCGLHTGLLLIALIAASGAASADPGAAAAAAAAVDPQPGQGLPAAAVGSTVLQPPGHLGIDHVAGTDRGPDCPACPECPQAPGLESFSNRLDGTYETGGKADTVTALAFPEAPQAGGSLDAWLARLNDELLTALDIRLDNQERTQYRDLENGKCSTIYCRIAMRQKTIYYLLGGK
jgi:hypothetical protein